MYVTENHAVSSDSRFPRRRFFRGRFRNRFLALSFLRGPRSRLRSGSRHFALRNAVEENHAVSEDLDLAAEQPMFVDMLPRADFIIKLWVAFVRQALRHDLPRVGVRLRLGP